MHARAHAHIQTQQICCSYIIISIFLGCPTLYACACAHMHTYVRTYIQLQPDLLGDICLMFNIHAWHAVKCRYTQEYSLVGYVAFGCSVHKCTQMCKFSSSVMSPLKAPTECIMHTYGAYVAESWQRKSAALPRPNWKFWRKKKTQQIFKLPRLKGKALSWTGRFPALQVYLHTHRFKCACVHTYIHTRMHACTHKNMHIQQTLDLRMAHAVEWQDQMGCPTQCTAGVHQQH